MFKKAGTRLIKAAKKRVVFVFRAPESAHEVKVCGSFSNWEQGAMIMDKGRGGEWKAQVSLEPGEYEYKFWADGVWYNDPKADRQTSNIWGSENSVKEVK
jgi:1,4-alpha-glucan branching enzyme